MEHHECEKFKEEVDKTGHLLKKLGFGIALFQVHIISIIIFFFLSTKLSLPL